MDLKSFGQAIRELAEEKGVPEEKVVETIELAIAAAYKKDYGKKGQVIRAKFNPETGELRFSQIKIVVDETMIKSEEEIKAEEAVHGEGARPRPAEPATGIGPSAGGAPTETEEAKSEEAAEVRKVRFNIERHIMLEEARAATPGAQPGEELEFALESKSDFGRIASQTAKQVIIQRIREAERDATYSEYKAKEGEILSGIVQRFEGRNAYIDLGRGVGLLADTEQIPRERLTIGERVKAIALAVERDLRGPGIYLSRSHPRFLAKLFELEVPEIVSNVVEIKTIAREAGARSKVAVLSHDPAVDPIGSMVGQRGVRVSTVINEINGEKIDIIEWAEDPARFIANALSPAKVLDVALNQERRNAVVTVPDDQLSLAIGKGGQNVRLAAKLTGWRIDVRSANAEAPRPAEAGGEAVATEAAHATEAADKLEETPAPEIMPAEETQPKEVTAAPTEETQKETQDEKAAQAQKPPKPKSKRKKKSEPTEEN